MDITIIRGAETRPHHFEIPPGANRPRANRGLLQVVVDGRPTEIDWAEIAPGVFSILLEGRSYEVVVAAPPREPAARPSAFLVAVGARNLIAEIRDPRLRRAAGVVPGGEGPREVLAPMPGKIVKVLVSENQQVRLGDGLIVIEAMKMQNEIRAPRAGRVDKVYVWEGGAVETGFKLLHLV